MIAIIDYDAGNLKSVEKALLSLGEETAVTREKDVILSADKVILPGVGAFGDAMEHLHRYGLPDILRQAAAQGTPLLGICLGMQLLFERSEESEGVEGLSILPGEILKIPPCEGLKIPHMGWNSLDVKPGAKLFAGLPEHPYVYFVHSYMANTADEYIAASCDYGVKVTALVQNKNVFGAQFHPEKSGAVGLTILKNFGGLTR